MLLLKSCEGFEQPERGDDQVLYCCLLRDCISYSQQQVIQLGFPVGELDPIQCYGANGPEPSNEDDTGDISAADAPEPSNGDDSGNSSAADAPESSSGDSSAADAPEPSNGDDSGDNSAADAPEPSSGESSGDGSGVCQQQTMIGLLALAACAMLLVAC